MPFLRVIRDKRGYETTYLMDWYREGTRQRSRILYVFRSPGNVRVGRIALDSEALRQIESQYPDISFDWRAVFDSRQVIESASEPRRSRRVSREAAETQEHVASPAGRESGQPGSSAEETAVAAPLSIPSRLEGETADERVLFLERWYPKARERVLQRVSDPLRREALLGLAERLNPANWSTADDLAAGLERASEALERLSRVLSRRRRRPRRRTSSNAESGHVEPVERPDPSVSDS